MRWPWLLQLFNTLFHHRSVTVTIARDKHVQSIRLDFIRCFQRCNLFIGARRVIRLIILPELINQNIIETVVTLFRKGFFHLEPLANCFVFTVTPFL